MLVSISHTTRYTLAAPAHYSIQSLRLTPPSFDGQKVKSWVIEMPHIEHAVAFRDCFGNMAHLVAIPEAHSAVTITASGVVETQDRAGSVRGLLETVPVRVFKRETPLTESEVAVEPRDAEHSDSCHAGTTITRPSAIRGSHVVF